MRSNNRTEQQMRPIKFTRHYTKHAEGSVLVEFGDTKVLCNASVVKGQPPFLRNTKKGWLTAEYSMLPRSTNERMRREASAGKQGGRTLEIQRLIGRSLRSMINLDLIGEYTITVDCDVIQADGGTRTASISGACIALVDAVDYMIQRGIITKNPIQNMIAAVSVGIVDGVAVSDLDYKEDSSADTDMNVVMNDKDGFIEVQGTAEGKTFNSSDLDKMITLAKTSIREIISLQKQTLGIVQTEHQS